MEKSKKGDTVSKPVVAKTTSDLQRIKLEKLMKNPVSVTVFHSMYTPLQ
jgi:hypothetical protein